MQGLANSVNPVDLSDLTPRGFEPPAPGEYVRCLRCKSINYKL